MRRVLEILCHMFFGAAVALAVASEVFGIVELRQWSVISLIVSAVPLALGLLPKGRDEALSLVTEESRNG